MKIKLNDEISADTAKLLESRLVIQANSGGGKSTAIRRIIEQTFGHKQIIIIDPEGEFGNMRGEYDFVYCGKGGDAPVESRSAALLATRLLELKVSAIVDLYELPPQERKHYVKLFFEAMINAPKELWPINYGGCFVFLDEADLFAPEKRESEALSSVIDMAGRGRKRGYCLVPATRRPAQLNKDVAAECNNKLIGRASLDIDRKRSAEELGFTTKEQVLSLRNLEPGEFYTFGPAISREVIKIMVGDVNVKPPRPGMGFKATPPPSAKVKAILSKLADLPKEAAEEAHTVSEYKMQLKDLRRQLTIAEQKVNVPRPEPTKIQKIEVPSVGKRALEQLVKSEKDMRKLIRDAKAVFVASGANIDRYEVGLNKLLTEIQKVNKPREKEIVFSKVPPIGTIPKDWSLHPIKIFGEERKIGICEKKIYSFLAKMPNRGWTKVQIGAITGYSPTSSGFNNALSALATAGVIQRQGDLITHKGVDDRYLTEVDDYTPDIWFRKLAKCEREIFRLLSGNPREQFTKTEIGERTNYSPISSGFNNALSHLNSIGLIRRVPGGIELNPELLEL